MTKFEQKVLNRLDRIIELLEEQPTVKTDSIAIYVANEHDAELAERSILRDMVDALAKQKLNMAAE